MIATSAGQRVKPQQGSTAPGPGQTVVPTQPQSNPAQFAQNYAANLQNTINQHKQYRVASEWDHLNNGAESMALNAPAQAANYNS